MSPLFVLFLLSNAHLKHVKIFKKGYSTEFKLLIAFRTIYNNPKIFDKIVLMVIS